MRVFWEVAKLSFQRHLTYRAAAMAGLATNFFFGLVRAAVLVALYGARQEVAGISLTEAVTFAGLSQATIGFLSIFSWYEVMNSVYTGDIAGDLLKPMHYFSFWLAQDLGRAVVALLLRGVTIMAAFALVFGITTPDSSYQWLALAAAMTLAWLVSFAWRFLVNLAAFWTPNALGIARLFFVLSWYLSGFFLPLRYFPDWFVTLCYMTPFPHTVNTVIEVYLGVLSGPAVVQALAAQIIWVVLLIGVGQLALRAGVRQLVIQGG
jgi:ABC-2 type transport system permease protein